MAAADFDEERASNHSGIVSALRSHVLGIVKTFDSKRGIGIIHGQNGGNYPVILAGVIRLKPLKPANVFVSVYGT
jgi:hypothetical protein